MRVQLGKAAGDQSRASDQQRIAESPSYREGELATEREPEWMRAAVRLRTRKNRSPEKVVRQAEQRMAW